MSSENIFFKRMAELLVFHKIIQKPEDLTEDNYNDMIMNFQEQQNIMVDGNAKWDTLWHLQYPVVMQEKKLAMVKCDAEIVEGSKGLDSLYLRQDAAERYNALRKEALDLGGVITTAGGKRELSEMVSSDKSITSLHYTGLAFDLATDTGFFNPDKDPFVVTLGGNRFWQIWMRTTKGTEKKLNAVYWENWNSGVDLKKTVQGTFVDFTLLCCKYGFQPIRPRMIFTRSHDRKYTGCEWWHFQASDLLIPSISQLGIELLRIEGYTEDYIKKTNENLWNRKLAIFNVDWF